MKVRSLAALLLLLFGAAPVAFPAPVSAAGNSCSSAANPFTINGATWGTPSSPASAYPGDQSIPLTITMLFSGPCTSPQTTFLLDLANAANPVPFTGPNGANQPKVLVLNLSPNTVFTVTFQLNIASSAATGFTYSITMLISYSNNDPSSLLTGISYVPIALYGPISINYHAGSSQLSAGQANNVTITISNTGSSTSGPVSTTVAAPTGVTLLNQLATTGQLAPGGATVQVLQVFVPSSLSGTAFALTFTGKYLDPYSVQQTTTQSLGFLPSTPTVQAGSSFLVTGAQWASAGSTTSPLPGTQDIALVVGLQYLGSTPVTSLQGTIQLPQGITDLNGRASATAFSTAATSQYGSVQLTFYLNLASTVKAGSYNYTLALAWMTSQSLGLAQTAILSPPPVGTLQSSFQVESATWGTSATAAAPVPGTQNEPLVITLQYLGTTSISNVQGTLTLPAGVTDLNGHGSATAYAASATANQVITLTYYLDVASAVKPASYNFSLGLLWTTSVGVVLSQTAVISPAPIGAATATSFPLSVVQSNSTLNAGTTAASLFQLTNTGTTSIYSPTFSLSVINPLVVASVVSSVPATQLDPGKSTTFTARLTSGPSAAPGVYGGTLTVAFTDQYGAAHTQTFPVAFTLKGTVILVLQNTQTSQSLTGFTVTGSILNEGSAAAYYSTLTGVIQGRTASPVYLGEIDPNTPLPFSITIPFVAPTTVSSATNTTVSTTSTGTVTSKTAATSRSFNFSRTITGIGNFTGRFPGLFGGNSTAGSASVTIGLALQYKDTFGQSQASPFTLQAAVKPSSQLSGGSTNLPQNTSSDQNTLEYVAYGVVGAIVLALIAGAVYVRRQRAKAAASLPPEMRTDKSVI